MLKVAKVVGLNSDQSAAQVLIHHLVLVDGDSSSNQLGQNSLFIVAKCSLDDAFTKTRQALSEAESSFYSSEGQISQRLEESLSVIKKSLSDAQDLQIIIASTFQEGLSARVLYLLCEGEDLSALLIRPEEQINLCQMTVGNKLVSGFLKPGDRLVITTNNLIEILGQDNRSLATTQLDVLEDDIISSLPHDKINPLAAVILEEEDLSEPKKEVKDPPQAPLLSKPTLSQEPLYIKTQQPLTILKTNKKYLIAILAIVLVGIIVWFGLQKLVFSPKSSSNSQTQENTTSPQISQTPANSHQLTDIPLWLDLNLIKTGFSASQITSYEDQLLILDQNQKTLVSVSLPNKSHQILAGEDKLGEAQLITLNGDSAWVKSQNKGLLRIDTKSTKVMDTIKVDPDWGEIASIYGFASNIYILDKAKNQIWKYVPVASGFSEKKSYLAEDVSVDFKDVLQMQIDGSVWLLKSNGEVLKFTQGVRDSFNLTGIDPGLTNPKSFFLSDETDNIYILDNVNKRVVVVNKKGNYLYQLIADKFSQAEGLVADEKNNKLYIQIGGKIYSTDLKI